MGYVGPGYGYPGYGYDSDTDAGDDGAGQGPLMPDAGPDAYEASGYGDPGYGQGGLVSPYLLAPGAGAGAPQQAQNAVTLIFKDGRAPEQIRNYIVTGNMLFVGNRWPSQIPLEQIDLAETVKVNRDAGVDFELPGASR